MSFWLGHYKSLSERPARLELPHSIVHSAILGAPTICIWAWGEASLSWGRKELAACSCVVGLCTPQSCWASCKTERSCYALQNKLMHHAAYTSRLMKLFFSSLSHCLILVNWMQCVIKVLKAIKTGDLFLMRLCDH